jgi:hypothetical protein
VIDGCWFYTLGQPRIFVGFPDLRMVRPDSDNDPLQIPGTDDHRPVRFRAAGKIFAARFLLYSRAVGSEYRQLAFPVSPKVVIQRLSADLSTHPRFSVLSP